jgi:hypothetical protein
MLKALKQLTAVWKELLSYSLSATTLVVSAALAAANGIGNIKKSTATNATGTIAMWPNK